MPGKMSSAIEKLCRGRVVRFEQDGDNRWTVVQNGHAFEVLQNDQRDDHGWTRHTYSLRRAGESEMDSTGLADLAVVAQLVCERAY
jgi:hypothetical protein